LGKSHLARPSSHFDRLLKLTRRPNHVLEFVPQTLILLEELLILGLERIHQRLGRL
jgi:hypothetical protein